MKRLNISIVVPAYNEETHLRLCLESIAKQTVKPFEVIVVDNNSTDATAAIAQSFPFVTLLTEKRQGPQPARDRGYNAARGDVIGRLDGDSVIAPDWVETIQKVFADPSVDAATGRVQYREVCIRRTFNACDFFFRNFLAKRAEPLGQQSMQGVNMATRRTAWLAVRDLVCQERRHHEDLDLSAHLALLKRKAVFEPRMIVTASFRQADARPFVFYHYVLSTPRTYRLHGLKLHNYMYFVASLVIAIYLPIRIAYRGYNPATGKFSLKCLLWPQVTTNRPSPIAASLTPLE